VTSACSTTRTRSTSMVTLTSAASFTFDCSPSILLPSARAPKLKLGPPGRVRTFTAIGAVDSPRLSREPPGGRYLENPIEPPPTVDLVEAQKSVGATIRRLRDEKKPRLTQKKLAEVLGCTVQHVQEVEGGRENLTIQSLIKFAKGLGVDWRQLIMPDG